MAKIIMALGRGVGPWYDPAKPEKKEPEYYEICLGPLVGEFSLEQVTIWTAAHDSLEEHSEHRFTRASLERLAREKYKITNPGPSVGEEPPATHGPPRLDPARPVEPTAPPTPPPNTLGGRAIP
ncbi:hypothetical protein AB0I28_17015 [Phytomonospora sp. NPDC050363]|uniref:hypothetical protein n=1 Tax=Phytomonospora sp. NPDC050363 TaxID=3155642 RepID=UPI00340CA043